MSNKAKGRIILISGVVLLASILILAGAVFLAVPRILSLIEGSTEINPDNFNAENREFFARLDKNTIQILSFCAKNPSEEKVSMCRISIVPLKKDYIHLADQDKSKAHANGTVLVYACHEILNGDTNLGKKLLDLLKKYDGDIVYDYPIPEPYPSTEVSGGHIYIDELVQAAEKYVRGDKSGMSVLQRPASQYSWRKKEYSK